MFYSVISRQYQSDGMSTVLPVNVLVRDLLNKHNVQSCTVFLMYSMLLGNTLPAFTGGPPA